MDWETLFDRVEREPTVAEIREALAARREQ
jgi:hypothetical protein